MRLRISPVLAVSLLAWAGLVASCTDAKQVNAAFAQTRVSWFVFEPSSPDGLAPLAGFEVARKVNWLPFDQVVRASDLLLVPGRSAAVAVSHLGLLLVEDSSGQVTVARPGSQIPLAPYRTDRLFLWKDKLFLTLTQSPPAEAPPATLAWWSAGQPRLAFYPVPSQVQDPTRQLVEVRPPSGGTSLVGLSWRSLTQGRWHNETSLFALDTGTESPASGLEVQGPGPGTADPSFAAVRARLADRLGAAYPYRSSEGPGPRMLFTADGWVSVGREGEAQARLYRLPDLGAAGRYTGSVTLDHGFLLSWETYHRGYGGAAGLVHVPFGVLAP